MTDLTAGRPYRDKSRSRNINTDCVKGQFWPGRFHFRNLTKAFE